MSVEYVKMGTKKQLSEVGLPLKFLEYVALYGHSL